MTGAGPQSFITQDRLRVDLSVEFYLRVKPDQDGVATAAQALAGKTFRAVELQEMIQGKLIGAIQGVVAQQTLDNLHENRLTVVNDIKAAVAEDLARNGLELESVSLTRLDQTPFTALDENNAFNAVGMRRLAEVITQNKRQRAAIEADADVAVRQSQLEANKRRLDIELDHQQAEINQQFSIETLKSKQNAEVAELNAQAEQRIQAAQLAKERQLRELRLNNELAIHIAEQQNSIDLTQKSIEVSEAEARASQAQAQAAAATELIQTEQAKAIAERARQIALIRATEQTEVSDQRSQSAAAALKQQAKAEATSQALRAQARQAELEAEAAGRKALAEADNSLSNKIIDMRIKQHKLDALPELVAQMVKPVEKIEGIRIHQITGLGSPGTNSEQPMVNQAMDSLLGMAVQLPVLQKLGQELGINFEQGVTRITEPPAAQPPDHTSQNNSQETPDESES